MLSEQLNQIASLYAGYNRPNELKGALDNDPQTNNEAWQLAAYCAMLLL
jgi:hypothetical protein